ncbi:MAG: Gfo/Idh/MocA family oxidoreductase [Planctomycetaceae bacterium]|nr:Gfo/Idh/MocA family oxidoreductase [Planctomycetaceae bacterium]
MHRREFLTTTAAVAAAFPAGVIFAAAERRWRVAVIGDTGRGNYGHGLHTMWLGLPQTEVVGIADPDEAGRAKAQAATGMPPGFADYHEMLAEVQPEIVVVAPRHLDQHRDMAVAAAQAGARGIYCEKPFCRTPAEADDIVAACSASGARLAIAHRNRYHPAIAVVQQAVADGAIGELLEIRGRGREDQRGGVQDLWVLGTHILDLTRCFGGEGVACSATLLQDHRPATPGDLRPGDEGVGPVAGNELHARFEMSLGVPAYFDSIRDRVDPDANFGLQLIGTKGLIQLRIDAEPLAHLVPGNPFRPTAEARPWIPISSGGVGVAEPVADMKEQVEQHRYAARDLLAAIEENRPPLSSDVDGRAIVEMTHAVLASHVHNGERITLPLEKRRHAFEGWMAGKQ